MHQNINLGPTVQIWQSLTLLWLCNSPGTQHSAWHRADAHEMVVEWKRIKGNLPSALIVSSSWLSDKQRQGLVPETVMVLYPPHSLLTLDS